jgi:hypothetical protein
LESELIAAQAMMRGSMPGDYPFIVIAGTRQSMPKVRLLQSIGNDAWASLQHGPPGQARR